jgi:hypothetical protein
MSDLNSGKADSAIFLDLQMYPGMGELLDFDSIPLAFPIWPRSCLISLIYLLRETSS